ncbi:small acid-soluble spore protein P [Sporomusa acidovorans]|uniref:Small, acid-soluble spore protein P n=1 Tax=Sporomusa acidovorans (strain ATCC 49682 / DSM 3132 / Mol) TaxID=1123286 RepID=A0ABZ3J085_SPOA4|nr:small acid-soluble spore protein P [Sporomusa acidovorans]OZC22810.1 small, acid-soluble spore protein P [Sporomusa acidovorans DSM 3132]SDE51601.1 small acid-soluble spore protein P (minor) [Sporomusa acidovorans]
MAKPEAYPVDQPNAPRHTTYNDNNMPEPLSGSKKVKNQNHTGQRHGEGS